MASSFDYYILLNAGQDMHYAEFAADEVFHSPGRRVCPLCSKCTQSTALREAIKEYEANKWKVIGQKVGKPAKVSCQDLEWTSLSRCRRASSMRRNILGIPMPRA